MIATDEAVMVDGSITLSPRQRRAGVMRQFELQMPKYPLRILERLTNYRYRMFDEAREEELLATVLVTSFQYYEHRLNLAKHGFSLIVCQRHNSAIPVYVLELDSAHLYKPGTAPDVRHPSGRYRRTQDEQRVLISQIILGVDAAMDELHSMPERTRRRYLKLRELYLRPKIGRPYAS